MIRLTRRAICSATIAALLLSATPALAGTYLNRAGLLLKHGLQEGNYLRAHVNDRELARIIHDLARTRLEAAGHMTVPKEVVQAHPHLLLVLENLERAADAARNGQVERFLVYHQRALDEERTFRSVLKQLGWSLPS